MTAPNVVVDPAPTATTSDSDIVHLFCACDEDRALCGLDVSDHTLCDDWSDDDECVVCVDLADLPCPRCGS